MQITISWQPPILLARHKKIVYDEDIILERVEAKPGVYYFSRRHGDKYSPFYIGESINLQGRLKNHLNSADIRDILRGLDDVIDEIAQGARYFQYGYLEGKSAKAKQCLDIVQEYMITEALGKGVPLINKQLTKVPTHTLTFQGSKIGKGMFPRSFSIRAK